MTSKGLQVPSPSVTLIHTSGRSRRSSRNTCGVRRRTGNASVNRNSIIIRVSPKAPSLVSLLDNPKTTVHIPAVHFPDAHGTWLAAGVQHGRPDVFTRKAHVSERSIVLDNQPSAGPQFKAQKRNFLSPRLESSDRK